MRYWVQYNDYEKMQSFPKGQCGIATDKAEVMGTVGDTIFVVIGVSESPKQYLLWERFVCEKVTDKGKAPLKYEALGQGWFLLQRRGREPLLNQQPNFRDYMAYTANFSRRFHEVTNHPFLAVLMRLSEQCKPPS